MTGFILQGFKGCAVLHGLVPRPQLQQLDRIMCAHERVLHVLVHEQQLCLVCLMQQLYRQVHAFWSKEGFPPQRPTQVA